MRPLKYVAGFTLIEVLIVTVIVAVLAAIAYPGYAEYTRNAKRAEAKATIIQIQQLQERWYTQNNAYQITYAGPPATPPTGSANWPVQVGNPANPSHTISWQTDNAANPRSVVITATPTGSFSDPKCNAFVLDAIGNKTISGATGTAAECWSR